MPTLEEFLNQKAAQTAGATALGGVAASPDETAKAIEMAPKLNVPAPVIKLDVPGFERRAKAINNARIVSGSSALQDYLNEDPLHAEVSNDDFEALSAWDEIGKAFEIGREEAQAGSQLGLKVATSQFGIGGQNIEELRKRQQAASMAREEVPWVYYLPMLAGSALGGIGQDIAVGGIPGTLAGAAAGGPVGATAGGLAGTAASGALSAYGLSLEAFAQAEAESGNTMNPALKQSAAVVVGSIAYAANFIGMKGPTQQALTGLASEALIKFASSKTASRAVGRAALEVGKAGLSGSALFGLMEAGTSLVQDLAKTVSEGEWDTIFNDPDKRTEAVDRIYRVMVDGAATMGAFHVPGAGANMVADLGRIRATRANADVHKNLVAKAGETATRGRSPEAFKRFAAKVVGDREIGIDVDLIAETGSEDAVRAIAPDFDRQVEVAASTGGAIQVPYADYLARMDPQVDNLLREGIRWEPGGLSLREAEGLEAWHGTPHEFDRFDLTKIGTGEGAQVYGHGLYFAENRKVGEEYQQALGETTYDGTPFNRDDPRHLAAMRLQMREDRESAIAFLEEDIKFRRDPEQRVGWETDEEVNTLIARDEEAIEHLRSGTEAKVARKGNLYRVKIRAKPEDLLDWDKPLSEQPLTQKIIDLINQAELRSHWLSQTTKMEDFGDEFTGGDAVRRLEDAFGDVEAARLLREAGISGIRYLDQGSRFNTFKVTYRNMSDPDKEHTQIFASRAGAENFVDENLGYDLTSEGVSKWVTIEEVPPTRNLVIFDDTLIDILDRNGEPLKGQEREDALVQYMPPEVTREAETPVDPLVAVAEGTEPPRDPLP